MTIPKYLFRQGTITEINLDRKAMDELTQHEMEVERLHRIIRVQTEAVKRATGKRKVRENEILEGLIVELKQLSE